MLFDLTAIQHVQECVCVCEHGARQAAVSRLLSTLEMECLPLERESVFMREVEKHSQMFFHFL